MEPVKGFLGRFLRRRLLEVEVQEGVRNNDLNRIFDWIPKVWQHLNKFLETHSSSDVTIGKKSPIYRIHLPHRALSHLLCLCLWWNIWYSQVFMKRLNVCYNLKLFTHSKLHAVSSLPPLTWCNICLVYLWHTLFLEIVFSLHISPLSDSCLSSAVMWVKLCVQSGMKASQSHWKFVIKTHTKSCCSYLAHLSWCHQVQCFIFIFFLHFVGKNFNLYQVYIMLLWCTQSSAGCTF